MFTNSENEGEHYDDVLYILIFSYCTVLYYHQEVIELDISDIEEYVIIIIIIISLQIM